MKTTITSVQARQIWDSRGRPTVEAEVGLAGGATGRACAPAGASRGAHEAIDLRDGGPRFGGLGVDGSAAIINHPDVAILGIGRMIERPWVVDGAIVARRIAQLSLVFDHRVCDGGYAASFLRRVMELLEHRGASCDFNDSHIGVIPPTREHPGLAGRKSKALSAETVSTYDVVLIATDHDAVDYGMLAQNGRLVVDTRNAMAARGLLNDRVVKA